MDPLNENNNEKAADNSEIQIKQFNLAAIKQINDTMRKLAGIWLLGLLAFSCEKETEPLAVESVPGGTSDSIKADIASHNGYLLAGEEAIGVNSLVPYFGTNLGTYPRQEAFSSGVTGLKAVLQAGRFSDTNGVFQIDISGFAPKSGLASFEFNVSGKPFVLKRNVWIYAASCGAKKVHNYDNRTYETLEDIDGNSYYSVRINNKRWMAENLKTTHYNTGELIQEVPQKENWDTIKTPAFCWYNNDRNNFDCPYGKLYNFYSINDTSKNVCPVGWRIPNAEDWNELFTAFGGENQAGEALKSAAEIFWASSSAPGKNTSGFSGLAGGQRNSDPDVGFFGNTFQANWWVSAGPNGENLQSVNILHFERKINRDTPEKNSGLSIRCVKNL